MIVVIGQPLYRATAAGPKVDGLAARIALAAAAKSRFVELVGKVGEDEAGEAVVLALSRSGIGHVAILREGGRPTSQIGPPDDPIDPLDATDPPTSAAGGDAESIAATTEGDLRGGATLEADDVDLALRYLTDFSVLVLAVPLDPDMARVVTAAAGWGDARLIVVLPADYPVPDGLPVDAIVFEAPESDPDGVFAAMVGSFAAALDDGGDPGAAFHATVEEAGWTPTPVD